MLMSWILLTAVPLLVPQEAGTPCPVIRDPNAAHLLGLQGPGKKGKPQKLPSATVEVTGIGERDAEHIRALTHWMTPILQASATLGYAQRESVQMLAEFMAMDPSKPHPPTLPSFWSNAQRPNGPSEELVRSWQLSPRSKLTVGSR